MIVGFLFALGGPHPASGADLRALAGPASACAALALPCAALRPRPGAS